MLNKDICNKCREAVMQRTQRLVCLIHGGDVAWPCPVKEGYGTTFSGTVDILETVPPKCPYIFEQTISAAAGVKNAK